MNWQTILAIDFDRWATETYRANFPGVRVECGSVADFIGRLPGADIVLGGPPCQPFSMAGEGEGENDDRDCIPDFIATVRAGQPRMFLMENVRGLITARHWPYFCGAIDALTECGYVVQWKLLDAVSFGVPQFRERVWVWGIRADLAAKGMKHAWPAQTHAWPWPEPCMFGSALSPAITVGWALNISHRQIDGDWFDGDDADGLVGIRRIRGSGVKRRDHGLDEPSPTVMAPTGGKSGLCKVYDHGVASPDLPSPTLKAGGNIDACGKRGGGCPPMLSVNPLSRPCPTLIGVSSKSHTSGLSVVNDKAWRKQFGIVEVLIDPKHPFQQSELPASTITSGGNGHGPTGNSIKLSVNTKQHRTRRGVSEPSPTVAGDSRHRLERDKAYCRRLTPLECLRLQSGPDDFVWPKKITKTNMYRIIGNGWASRMGEVFSEAFHRVDPESKSVIDLFCGGGLCAVGWHGRSWKYETAFPGIEASNG